MYILMYILMYRIMYIRIIVCIMYHYDSGYAMGMNMLLTKLRAHVGRLPARLGTKFQEQRSNHHGVTKKKLPESRLTNRRRGTPLSSCPEYGLVLDFG